MKRRGEIPNPDRAVHELLELLTRPWTYYIFTTLAAGPIRFGELRRRISGISARLLTERLREMETTGLVFREHTPTTPPAVTYGLTKRGEELIKVFDTLLELTAKWQKEDNNPRKKIEPATVPLPETSWRRTKSD